MAKFFGTAILVLSIILFPPAALALVSNNAIPGDATYPVKRSLEDIIFAAVSLNPVSKAWFAAARSNRRFEESIKLVIKDQIAAAKSLNELVEQTEVAAKEIEGVADPVKKEQLKQELSSAIEKYNESLSQVKNQLKQENGNFPTPAPVLQTPTPTTTPFPVSQTAPRLDRPSASVMPAYVPASAAPSLRRPIVTPRPTAEPTQIPTSTPTPMPTQAPAPTSNLTSDQIGNIQTQLQQIQHTLNASSANKEREGRGEMKKEKNEDKGLEGDFKARSRKEGKSEKSGL